MNTIAVRKERDKKGTVLEILTLLAVMAATGVKTSFNLVRAIHLNERAEGLNPGIIIGVIVVIAVGVIMISAMFPPAFDTFYSTNTSAWKVNGSEDTKVTNIWEMMPMMAGVAGLLVFVGIVIAIMR